MTGSTWDVVVRNDDDPQEEPREDPDTSLTALTGAGLEALGHAVTQAEGDVSGPIYEIESRLKDMTVGDIMKVKTVAEVRRQEIERDMHRRLADIGRVQQAVAKVLKGEA